MSDFANSNDRGGRGKLLLGIVVLLLVSPYFLPVKAWLLQALELLRGFGIWGLVGLSVAYVVACILMLPGSILTLGAGFIAAALWPESLAMALFGGGVSASIGSTLGATAAFLLGRTVLRERAARAIAGNPRFRAMDDAIGQSGFKMVFLLRLSPVFPFNVLNYALGLTKVRLRDYFFASWIGMFPGMLLYVYLGATAQNLAAATGGARDKSPQEYAVLVIGLLATLLVVVLVTRAARKALKEAVAEPAAGQE